MSDPNHRPSASVPGSESTGASVGPAAGRTALRVVDVGPEHTDAVLGLIHRAFAARRAVEPPSTALAETSDTVRAALAGPGGLLTLRREVPVGALLLDDSRPGLLGMRRVSVDPARQAHGVASAMVGVAEDVAEHRGLDGVWLRARAELSDTVRFWRRRGYRETRGDGSVLELGKTLWLALEAPTPEATRACAARLATLLSSGDLVVLTGELGAGKTVFTQGIAAGLDVRGPVTSPTFVISRLHPPLGAGPALVHVDAYRLGGASELDDLDLDASVDEAVTVVEWGAGLAEGLAESWLDVRVERWGQGGAAALAAAGPRGVAPDAAARCPESRVLSLRPHGPRWVGVPLRSSLSPWVDVGVHDGR